MHDCAAVSDRPLYSFGHGLSYSTFDYSDLQVSAAEKLGIVQVQVRFKATSTRTRANDEVAQLYLRDNVG
jgi:beta-glucosidase